MRPKQFLPPTVLVFAAILLAIVQAVAATPGTCYPALALSTEGIPPATAGSSYSDPLVAKGGQPPYTWSFGRSELPPGFSIDSHGNLTGTPVAAGDYNFHVVVTDSLKNSVTAGYTLTVAHSAGTPSAPTQGSIPPPASPPTTKPAPPPNTKPTWPTAPGFLAPELPQATVNLALPAQGTSTCPTLTTGSDCIRNVPARDATSFQNAINAATCGDTIVLQAGSTYSGNFTIPATSCTGWVEIVSSNMSSLPAPGNRVSPSETANMPVISTPNAAPAIAFLPNSNHWRVIGAEITTSHNSLSDTVYNLVMLGYEADNATMLRVLTQFPSYIILDRTYIEGQPSGNVVRGIFANALDFALVDSYCADIHDNEGNDSQCLDAFNGTGPILLQNNFLSAGSEDLAFGGTDPPVSGWNPSDITVVGNVMQKDTAWRGLKAPYNWSIKNNFELKNAKRVLLDGNVMQYTWDDAQHEAIIIRSDDQEGKCTWCTVADVTVTHNLIRHAAMGIVIDALNPSDGISLPTTRVLIQNNVWSDISNAKWGTGGDGWVYEILGIDGYPASSWIIDHNTSFSDKGTMELGYDKAGGIIHQFQFTNNIGSYGTYGIFGQGGLTGKAALDAITPGYIYGGNVLLGVSEQSGYPPGTYWNTVSGTGFSENSGTGAALSGNFQLTGSSPYRGAGTDGKDIGVKDWTCFNASTQAALAGNYNASIGSCFRGSRD